MNANAARLKEYPYWLDTIEPAASVTIDHKAEVAIPAKADVVVVGAGYTGLSAARRLAKSGASVLVLEREDIGFGASSRNGGQVLTGLKLDPATLVARYGESRARSLFDGARESIGHLEALIVEESIDCQYERTGHVQAAFKPSHFESFREEQSLLARVFNHRVELVSRDRQRTELGSDAYHGLSVDENSAALNPAQLVNGLARAAQRAGSTVVTGTAVERVTKRPRGWEVATTRGSVEAGELMFATNAYGGSLPPPAIRRGLMPIGSYIIATEPLTPSIAATLLPKRRMVFDSKNFLFYFRLTDDRRLLFGGRAEFAEPTEASVRRAAGILRRGMTWVFPELADTRLDYAWGGRVAFTRDQLPHAGRLDGAYFAAGYCGHGIAMSTTLGDLVGRRILGESIASPFLDDRAPALPLYGGNGSSPWFLPLAGAYYRVMDWIT